MEPPSVVAPVQAQGKGQLILELKRYGLAQRSDIAFNHCISGHCVTSFAVCDSLLISLITFGGSWCCEDDTFQSETQGRASWTQGTQVAKLVGMRSHKAQ
jgi:hypothetical protein